MKFTVEAYLEVCRRLAKSFSKKCSDIPYERHGIILSEGFAVCAMAEYFEIEVLIESGIGGARSTEIFGTFLSSDVIGIDNCLTYGGKRFLKAQTKLAKFNNVELIKGDSLDLVPHILKQLNGKRAGLFIDGPKGQTAIDFAKKCFKANRNLVFVGIHDMCKEFDNHLMDIWDATVFYTDSGSFREEFGFLDAKDFDWLLPSGMRLGDRFKSGCVIGFAVNEMQR